MPSSITHELIAEETEELLPSGAREAIRRAPDYYFLGAQGPDLFFFYRPFAERKNNFGRQLHRELVYEWFTALLSLLSDRTGREFECCLAYSLGFCSHLAGDVVFHPFVYRFLRKTGARKHVHQRIENDWDVYFLKELQGQSVRGYRYPFDLRRIAEEGILFRFLSACAQCIGRTLQPAPFRKMMSRFRVYLSHFHTEKARPLRALGFADFYPRESPDPDVLGGENFGELAQGKGKNADELFLSAVKESAACISAFISAFNSDEPLSRVLFSRHLLTGETIGT